MNTNNEKSANPIKYAKNSQILSQNVLEKLLKQMLNILQNKDPFFRTLQCFSKNDLKPCQM